MSEHTVVDEYLPKRMRRAVKAGGGTLPTSQRTTSIPEPTPSGDVMHVAKPQASRMAVPNPACPHCEGTGLRMPEHKGKNHKPRCPGCLACIECGGRGRTG